MKRKLFLGMFAAAGMLFATSCTNNELDVVRPGDLAQVTFSLVEDNGISTRTISDGMSADMLYYAIYNEDNELITTISPSTDGLFTKSGAFPNGSRKDEVTITLTKGQKYTAVFWAQNSACEAYTVKADTDGLIVDVDYVGDNNDETRDAFFKAETFNVTGNVVIDVELKRPFAQINVGITEDDWNAAISSGITISESRVVIKNAATSINLLTGEVGDETTAVVYDFAAIPANSNEVLMVDVDHDGAIGEDEKYKYLSMSYILTDNDAGKTTLESDGLQFTFRSVSGKEIVFDEGLHAVPVQRNWRTNILGKLLTGNIQFNIFIDYIFDDDYNYPEFESVTNGVKYDAASGTYYIYSVAGLQWLSDETNTNNNQFSGYTVKLISNIDMTNVDWIPIGTNTSFNGTFDGGNNTITNLAVKVTDDNAPAGLFGNVTGDIRNVKMSGVNISGHYRTGAIVGSIYGNIDNCHVDGGRIVSTPDSGNNNANNVGGIVGYVAENGTNGYSVSHCSVNDLEIEAYRSAGGIAGCLMEGATVDSCNVNNTTVIANMLCEYADANYLTAASAKVDKVVGDNGYNVNLSSNTTNDVDVMILAFDENNELNLSSGKELQYVGAAVASGYDMDGKTVKLDSDVDLKGVEFAPIGYNPETGTASPFKGTFDGNGKTVRNLYQEDLDGAYTQSVGLFATVEDATVKNLTVENIVAAKYGAEASAIASIASGNCTFEGIDVLNCSIVAYNNDAAAIVGWANAGNYTFKDITVGNNVTVHSLWNSYDTTLGGIIGTLENGSTVNLDGVDVACKLDAYNDVCSNYQWGAYRRAGMLIGNIKQTQNINGTNYPNPAAAGVTCNNVNVTYGDWMNYHYCEFKSNGHGSYDDENTWKCSRVEGSDWGTDTIDTTQCNHEPFESHNMLIAFAQLFGGGQGVYGLKEYDGVNVIYPESYNPGE